MNLFFTIFGFIFVCIFGTVTNYVYDLYPINKITTFFNPITKGMWGRISVTAFPILIWALLEVPVLSTNSMFLISVMLYLFLSFAIIYVIKYWAFLYDKENNFINLMAVFVSALIGEVLTYLLLMIGSYREDLVLISFFVILGLLALYIILNLFLPKKIFNAKFISEDEAYDNQKK